MKHLALVALVACGGGSSSTPTNTLGNTAKPGEPPPGPVPAGCRVLGVIADAKTDEPLIGATVVATGEGAVSERVAVTDERGQFNFELEGHDKLTVYYNDGTGELSLRDACNRRMRVRFDSSSMYPPGTVMKLPSTFF